jgi:hypothetical protein
MRREKILAEKIFDDLQELEKDDFSIDSIKKYFKKTKNIDDSIVALANESLEEHKDCVEESLSEDDKNPIIIASYGKNRVIECENCNSIILDEEVIEQMHKDEE